MDQADALAKFGYRDVGYTLVNIDDCWSNKKGLNNYQVENVVIFTTQYIL